MIQKFAMMTGLKRWKSSSHYCQQRTKVARLSSAEHPIQEQVTGREMSSGDREIL